MPQSLIYYIRHGQTDWNAEKRFQGQRNIALNEKGREQARRNGQKLKARHDDFSGFSFIASPLERTQQTMRLLRTELGLAPDDFLIEPQLIEISYGEFEGRTLDELTRENPEMMARRDADRWHFQPRGGESLEQARTRVKQALAGLAGSHVIVAHGAVGRVVRQIMLGLEPDEVAQFDFPQDKVFCFSNGREEIL